MNHEEFKSLSTIEQNTLAWKMMVKDWYFAIKYPGMAFILAAILYSIYLINNDLAIIIIQGIIAWSICFALITFAKKSKEIKLKELRGEFEEKNTPKVSSWSINTSGFAPNYLKANVLLKSGLVIWNVSPHEVSEKWCFNSENPIVEFLIKR
jgi:hypothetical protein